MNKTTSMRIDDIRRSIAEGRDGEAHTFTHADVALLLKLYDDLLHNRSKLDQLCGKWRALVSEMAGVGDYEAGKEYQLDECATELHAAIHEPKQA